MSTATHTIEKHYTPAELGKLWHLHPTKVRELFKHEPDVLRIEDPKPTRIKRPYSTLRIPESVVERVHRRMSNV